MGATNRIGASLGHAEMLDLALGDQVLDGPGDVFDGDVRVHAVLVEQVDAFQFSDACKRGFCHGANASVGGYPDPRVVRRS
jgi:hypothetical protein